MTYTVTAERGADSSVWVLQCVEAPGAISQTRKLSEARELMAEAIAFVEGVDKETVNIDLRPLLPDNLIQQVREAQSAGRQLQSAQRATARKMRDAVAAMERAGLSGAEMATVLGISPQRVSQLRAPRQAPLAS